MNIIKFKTKFIKKNFIKTEANILKHLLVFLEFRSRVGRFLCLRTRRTGSRRSFRRLLFCRRSRLFFRRVVTVKKNLTTMSIIIIMKVSLKEFFTFLVLALDDNIGIIRIIVEHTDSVIRFMFANRSALLGESETKMRFIRTLINMFKKIIFSITLVFNILEHKIGV